MEGRKNGILDWWIYGDGPCWSPTFRANGAPKPGPAFPGESELVLRVFQYGKDISPILALLAGVLLCLGWGIG